MTVKPMTVKDLDAYIAGKQEASSAGSPPPPKPNGTPQGVRNGTRPANVTGTTSATPKKAAIVTPKPKPAAGAGIPPVTPAMNVPGAKRAPKGNRTEESSEESSIQAKPAPISSPSESSSEESSSAPAKAAPKPQASSSEESGSEESSAAGKPSAQPRANSTEESSSEGSNESSEESSEESSGAAASSASKPAAKPIRLTEDSALQNPKPDSSAAARRKPKPKPKPAVNATAAIDPLQIMLREEEERDRRAEQQALDQKYRLQQQAARLELELRNAANGTRTPKRQPMPAPVSGQLLLQGAHRAYGNGFATPQFQVIGSICYLSGMIRLAHVEEGKSNAVAIVPGNCRPTAQLVFESAVYGVANARIDVLVNGDVVIRYFAGRSPWMSLSGIAFSTSRAANTAIPLLRGWRNLGMCRCQALSASFGSSLFCWPGHGYNNASFTKDGDVCFLSGVVDGANIESWDTAPILRLPEACQVKNGRISLLANQNRDGHRVDVRNIAIVCLKFNALIDYLRFRYILTVT